jgi:hypothetical protein
MAVSLGAWIHTAGPIDGFDAGGEGSRVRRGHIEKDEVNCRSAWATKKPGNDLRLEPRCYRTAWTSSNRQAAVPSLGRRQPPALQHTSRGWGPGFKAGLTSVLGVPRPRGISKFRAPRSRPPSGGSRAPLQVLGAEPRFCQNKSTIPYSCLGGGAPPGLSAFRRFAAPTPVALGLSASPAHALVSVGFFALLPVKPFFLQSEAHL